MLGVIMNYFLSLASLCAGFLLAGSVRAEAPSSEGTLAPESQVQIAPDATRPQDTAVTAPLKALDPSKRIETRLTADVGVFKDDHSGGFAVGGELLHRRGLLALGVVGEYGATIFTPYTYVGGAGGAGISFPTPSWMRADVLGLVGVHRYDGVGGLGGGLPTLGPQDDGVAGTLPSIGGRLSTTFEIGRGPRLVLGLKATVDRDLGQISRTHVRSYPFSTPETVNESIGGTRLAGFFTLGGTLDH